MVGNHRDKWLDCLSLVRLIVLTYCNMWHEQVTDTRAHLFFLLSLLAAALSSLQLPLSLYLLTHLSRGEVVTQHEGVVSFPALFSLTCPLLFLCFHSFLLSFTACNLLSKISNFSLWCSFRALWSAACQCLHYLSVFLWNWHFNRPGWCMDRFC